MVRHAAPCLQYVVQKRDLRQKGAPAQHLTTYFTPWSVPGAAFSKLETPFRAPTCLPILISSDFSSYNNTLLLILILIDVQGTKEPRDRSFVFSM